MDSARDWGIPVAAGSSGWVSDIRETGRLPGAEPRSERRIHTMIRVFEMAVRH
ncbi:hypothetical protein [Sphingobium sp.]|uniref:hypothetical protein n=1 Tax=Sphingobium sp. TaxID=1912891 RepID=UPI003BB73D8E